MSSGPAFWLTLSGWLAFAAHVLWTRRERIRCWLEDLLDPPRPVRWPTAKPRSHVRVVKPDA